MFKSLCKLWSHSGMTQKRELLNFNAYVTSKVLYCLALVWLLKADKSRMDAFQCYCVRRIISVAPSFISRVSNDDVLARASQIRFSISIEVC